MPYVKEIFCKRVPVSGNKTEDETIVHIKAHGKKALSWIYANPWALTHLCNSFHRTGGGAFSCGGIGCSRCMFGSRSSAIKILERIGGCHSKYFGYDEDELI